MPIYQNSAQLYDNVEELFKQISAADAGANEALLKSRLCIRLRCSDPDAELVIDARQRPLQIHFGPVDNKSDLEIGLSTDTLHQILMGNLTLTKALGRKQIVPQGPVWKTMVLADLFRHAQKIYPELASRNGLMPD